MHQMLNTSVVREIIPLSANDCFTILSRDKNDFDVPLHYHEEYELTLILNACGAKRVVGNSIGIAEDAELVLIGPNLCHSWLTHKSASDAVSAITIQFHRDLFEEGFLRKNQLSQLRAMLDNAKRGILFFAGTVSDVTERIQNLNQKSQFEAVLELLSIFHILSISPNIKLLSDPGFSDEDISHKSKRICKVLDFINNNFDKYITLEEVAEIALMPPSSFSRFFKKRTGKTFIECLNEIRLGHASRMLINTNFTIAEIAYKCGFNNMSNFNRTFKNKKSCIPKDFRKTYLYEKRFYV